MLLLDSIPGFNQGFGVQPHIHPYHPKLLPCAHSVIRICDRCLCSALLVCSSSLLLSFQDSFLERCQLIPKGSFLRCWDWCWVNNLQVQGNKVNVMIITRRCTKAAYGQGKLCVPCVLCFLCIMCKTSKPSLGKDRTYSGRSCDLLHVNMLTASEANFCFEVGARSLSQRQVCCRKLHLSARVE